MVADVEIKKILQNVIYSLGIQSGKEKFQIMTVVVKLFLSIFVVLLWKLVLFITLNKHVFQQNFSSTNYTNGVTDADVAGGT